MANALKPLTIYVPAGIQTTPTAGKQKVAAAVRETQRFKHEDWVELNKAVLSRGWWGKSAISPQDALQEILSKLLNKSFDLGAYAGMTPADKEEFKTKLCLRTDNYRKTSQNKQTRRTEILRQALANRSPTALTGTASLNPRAQAEINDRGEQIFAVVQSLAKQTNNGLLVVEAARAMVKGSGKLNVALVASKTGISRDKVRSALRRVKIAAKQNDILQEIWRTR